MKGWSPQELSRIADADELEISPRRADGTHRSPTPIWVVRVGDDLYVRAYRGRHGVWFSATQERHQGHISAGGVDRDVVFIDEPDQALNDQIDDAYRGKYGRYEARYVDPMLADAARAATLKLVPQ
ncbi:DUF2255 family protein [Streptomyces sp. NPDC095613]|uniref:DUF2255 family protein n=1 Tax=Streptomyces sp. NPDC095613 TaxID=3155540 RepID=UPI003328DF56